MLTTTGCGGGGADGGASAPSPDPTDGTTAATGTAVTDPAAAQAAYAELGAFAVGDEITVGEARVRLDDDIAAIALTSIGAVALTGGAGDRVWLVRPTGEVSALGVPAAALAGDLTAPRVAWVDQRRSSLVLHVWDVETDRSLGEVTVPATVDGDGDSGGIDPTALIPFEGGVAYVPTSATSYRVQWRTGQVRPVQGRPFDLRAGVVASTSDEGVVVRRGSRTLLRLDEASSTEPTVKISPDGRTVLVTSPRRPALVDLADGTATPVAGLGPSAAWTPDGHLVGQPRRQDPAQATVLSCDAAARCTSRPADGVDDITPLVLPAPPPAG